MSNELNKFIDYAIEHGEAILNGNSTVANKIHKKTSALIEKHQIRFEDYPSLLEHENESVRLWVSTHLLKKGSLKAKSVLEDLEKSEKIFSINAKIVLDLYSKGLLK